MERIYKITSLKNQYNNIKEGDTFLCDSSVVFEVQVKKELIAAKKFRGMPLNLWIEPRPDLRILKTPLWKIEVIEPATAQQNRDLGFHSSLLEFT